MSLNELLVSVEVGLIYGIITIGIYLTFRVIDFPDLTCDGSFALGAVVSAVLIKAGYHPYISLIIALIAGVTAGSMTGLLHTQLKISQLLSGILVAFMLYSINLQITGGIPNIVIIDERTIFTHYNPLILLLIICIIVSASIIYFLRTDFGLAFRTIGHNKKLATLNGVNVNMMTIFGLALSNGLVALGGAIFNQHQGFADVSSGVGTVIIGLTAVIIGEKLLAFKSPSWMILSCIIGSIIYRIFIIFALHGDVINIETYNLNLITGILIIGVMVLPRKKSC